MLYDVNCYQGAHSGQHPPLNKKGQLKSWLFSSFYSSFLILCVELSFAAKI